MIKLEDFLTSQFANTSPLVIIHKQTHSQKYNAISHLRGSGFTKNIS